MSEDRSLRPRKCPVGTIRTWQVGEVIKLHEGSDFGSGWYPLIDFKHLSNLAKRLDLLAQKFTSVKSPVDGETFLDFVISNYKRDQGAEHGPFTPGDFKQYEGHYGALKYSFRNEFYKRANKVREEMYTDTNDALLRESGGSKNGITDDRVKEIRNKIKAQFEGRLDAEIDTTEFERLGGVIDQSYALLVAAQQLTPDEQKVVDQIKDETYSIPRKCVGVNNNEFIPYFEVVKDVAVLKQQCIKNFGGNWLLLESQFDIIDRAFNAYLSNNKKGITEEVQEFSKKQLGMDITGPVENFYSDLKRKVIENANNIKTYADPEDIFKGEHTVRLPDGTHGDINIEYGIHDDGIGGSAKITITGDPKFISKLRADHLYLFKTVEDGKIVYVYAGDTKHLRGVINRGFDDMGTANNTIGALMSLINELHTPDDSNCENYKKLYLSGREMTTYFKGVEVKCQMGFYKSEQNRAPHISYSRPTISLSNIKDAAKFEKVVLAGLQERGFTAAEAQLEWKGYVAENQFPLEKYDFKAILADQTFRGTFIQAKLDIVPVLNMRFNARYNKQLTGDWNVSNLETLRQIELTVEELPYGHVVNNKNFVELMRDSQYNKAFAFYNNKQKKIQFSDACLRATSKEAKMDGSNYFKCTLVHEIGHAVSEKLGDYKDENYRKFANECGWSYNDNRTTEHATGDEIRIPREGKNSHIPLITDYANVSPEEAFAEYYSFYHNNKKELDEWLEVGEVSYLKKYSITNPNLNKPLKYQLDGKPMQQHWGLPDQYALVDQYRNDVTNANEDYLASNFTDEIDMNLEPVDPWKCDFDKSIDRELTKKYIAEGRDNLVCTPAILVKHNNGTYYGLSPKGFETSNILEANRYLQRNTPAVCISERAYDKLSQNNTDLSICLLMLDRMREEKVPDAEKISVQNEKQEGLYYDNKVIDYRDIKKSENIIRQLQTIYNSEKIVKAMIEAFGDETVKKNNILTSLIRLQKTFNEVIVEPLQKAFSDTKKKYTKYADVLVITAELKILFLIRNKDSKFMPDKLCLPGGHIDEGESALTAAVRELREETNYNIGEDDVKYITSYTNDNKSKTYYFVHYGDTEFDLRNHLVLQNVEQTNFCFIPIHQILDELVDKSLFIPGLTDRIRKMIDNNDLLTQLEEKELPSQYTPLDSLFDKISMPETPYEALGYLEKELNKGNLSEDDYIKALFDYKEFVV